MRAAGQLEAASFQEEENGQDARRKAVAASAEEEAAAAERQYAAELQEELSKTKADAQPEEELEEHEEAEEAAADKQVSFSLPEEGLLISGCLRVDPYSLLLHARGWNAYLRHCFIPTSSSAQCNAVAFML